MRAGLFASMVSLLAAGAVGLSFAGGVSGSQLPDAGLAAPDGAVPATSTDGGATDVVALPPPPPPPPPPPSPPSPPPPPPPPLPPPPETTISTTPPPPPERDRDSLLRLRDRHFLGAGLDLGVSGPLPDFGILAAYEPYRFLRVSGGFDYNLIGFGVKGGLTLINPFVVPVSFTTEFGHFFETDANSTVRKFIKKQKMDVASLKKVGYDYTNLLLGFEAGSRLVRFYIRGGVTFTRATASDFQESLQMSGVMISRASDPKISYQGPTFKLGFFFFFP